MYFETSDFMTVWNLGQHWAGYDGQDIANDELPEDLKIVLYRILHSVIRFELHVRTKKGLLFDDKSLFGLILELKHFLKIGRCIRKGIFDVNYLNTLYLKRSDVLRWCERDYLSPPKIWAIQKDAPTLDESYDSTEDENSGWYEDLSVQRKKRVACLELAKRLWERNPNQSYEQIYTHPVMKDYGNPNAFSPDAFKKWSRPFASEYAKTGGRPREINKL